MPFVKPENALKRAEEFIDVGKKQRALDTLYEVIKSKKHRQWQKINEQIMKSYLELCVELKESHLAKDGLIQYKNICQNVNLKSLEEIVLGYLQLAEEKAETAKREAIQSNANIMLTDVDDLEVLNSPESLLLKAVSGESSQDRADRDLLAPWLKFVWESYKQCLELLKNNNKVENIYHQVAKLAFLFCAKYQRKTEFRKLCETIRQHMVLAQRYALSYGGQGNLIDLTKSETQNAHLETRLLQLNHAISMELWQEAYKAVEDIYGLMAMNKSKPKPIQMFNYYSKLSLIFWKAGNQLFHAASLQKQFVLLKEQKKTITQEELTRISTRLLLSTLAIPIAPSRSTIDECLEQDEVTQDKAKRLTALLHLTQTPTRISLLKDLAKYNAIQHVHPEIRDLYKCLEVEFDPLKLSERVTKCLSYIEKLQASGQDVDSYFQYVQPIKELAVTRLLKQISQIYTSIEMKRFAKLTPSGIELFELEKLIVDAAKSLDLQVRLNHQTKSIHFGNDLYVAAQKEDLPEGPSIQSMPSEQIRNQLMTMTNCLQEAQQLIYASQNSEKRREVAQTVANLYRQTCEKHHNDLLRRKIAIEELKEMYERLREQAEAEEASRRLEAERAAAAAAAERRDSAISNQVSKPTFEQVEENEDDQVKLQIEKLEKEKKEKNERLKKEEKKNDHFVRACHEVELPFVAKFAEEDAKARKKFWDEKEVERIENLKREQQIQAENRDRLLRMVEEKLKFEKNVHDKRGEIFQTQMAEFQQRLQVAREQKLRERREQRKVERRTAYLKEIEDRKKREEEERRRREDEEKRRKQDEIAEKQRQREREIEEKQQRKLEDERQAAAAASASAKPATKPSGAYVPKSMGGPGFQGSRPQPVSAADTESSWRKPLQSEERPRAERGHDESRRTEREEPPRRGIMDESSRREEPSRRGIMDDSSRREEQPRRGIMDDSSRRGPMQRKIADEDGPRGQRGPGSTASGGPPRPRQTGQTGQTQGKRFDSKADSSDSWRRGPDNE